jgi:hypothetical protein
MRAPQLPARVATAEEPRGAVSAPPSPLRRERYHGQLVRINEQGGQAALVASALLSSTAS